MKFTQTLDERRESSRLLLNRMVIVKEGSGQVNKLVGVNYSVGGMALNSRKPLSSGEFVNVQFWITEPEEKEIIIRAEVLNFYRQGSVYTNSLKFVDEIVLN